MFTVTHSLGEFEYIFAKRQLKLTTDANVTLSCLDASHFPSSNVFQYLEDLLANRTWINSGNSFTIRFFLGFNGIAVEQGASRDHIEHLGLLLQDAEVLLNQSIKR